MFFFFFACLFVCERVCVFFFRVCLFILLHRSLACLCRCPIYHLAVSVSLSLPPSLLWSEGAYWLYLGSDEIQASSGTSGRCTGNLFKDNLIDGSARGVYMSETRDNMITSNIFLDTPENELEDSDGLLWNVSWVKQTAVVACAGPVNKCMVFRVEITKTNTYQVPGIHYNMVEFFSPKIFFLPDCFRTISIHRSATGWG